LDLTRIAKTPGRLELAGAPEGFDALVVADIARARKAAVVFVARDGGRATTFEGALAFFAPDVPTLVMPSWDCLPYDRIGPSPGVGAARMATLAGLAALQPGAGGPRVIIVTAPALLQRVPPRAAIADASYQASSRSAAG
jgi:transcription-repair coupling factor (superfamily II helicase)